MDEYKPEFIDLKEKKVIGKVKLIKEGMVTMEELLWTKRRRFDLIATIFFIVMMPNVPMVEMSWVDWAGVFAMFFFSWRLVYEKDKK